MKNVSMKMAGLLVATAPLISLAQVVTLTPVNCQLAQFEESFKQVQITADINAAAKTASYYISKFDAGGDMVVSEKGKDVPVRQQGGLSGSLIISTKTAGDLKIDSDILSGGDSVSGQGVGEELACVRGGVSLSTGVNAMAPEKYFDFELPGSSGESLGSKTLIKSWSSSTREMEIRVIYHPSFFSQKHQITYPANSALELSLKGQYTGIFPSGTEYVFHNPNNAAEGKNRSVTVTVNDAADIATLKKFFNGRKLQLSADPSAPGKVTVELKCDNAQKSCEVTARN